MIGAFLHLALVIPATLFAGLAIFVLMEVIASLFPRRPPEATAAPAITIIVPAHNEGEHLRAPLAALCGGLRDGDRVLVVADNCNDETASVAREVGAAVIERNDPDQRGKGFALQFAIDHLKNDPPTVVGFIDADCYVSDGGFARLAAVADTHDRPAQALNLMQPPENADARHALAAFAWLMINQVRMTGLDRLSGATRFTGTGMAAPWAVIEKTAFASADIAEDLALTFKFAQSGAAPLFVRDVLITSVMPSTDEARMKQRARWERGSLAVMANVALQAFRDSVLQLHPTRIMLALDAMIPPVILFAILGVATTVVSGLFGPVAGWRPFAVAFSGLTALGAAIVISWSVYGRKVLPAAALGGVVPFVLEKIRIYGAAGGRSTKSWTRTERDGGSS